MWLPAARAEKCPIATPLRAAKRLGAPRPGCSIVPNHRWRQKMMMTFSFARRAFLRKAACSGERQMIAPDRQTGRT